MENYVLKSEFHRRLVNVYREIDRILVRHSESSVPVHCTSLLPVLFSLYTFMWCKSWSDLIKRVK